MENEVEAKINEQESLKEGITWTTLLIVASIIILGIVFVFTLSILSVMGVAYKLFIGIGIIIFAVKLIRKAMFHVKNPSNK